MKAFHSFWSKPNRIRNHGAIKMPDYELLVLILSALKWRQLNGPITMVTDSAGQAFFAENGLEDLWGEPVDTCLDHMDPAIDPFLFWAAGKLYALKSMPCPCVMLDTDMIIWKDIGTLFGQDIIAAHVESLGSSAYPDPDVFRLKEDYQFPPEWDFTVDPVNTAFLYMPDSDFRDYYIRSAFDFMAAAQKAEVNPVVSMCFAEQRILPMCAQAGHGQIKYLIESRKMYHQRTVTHLWGHKRILSESADRRELFCVKCVKRILREFPEWDRVLAGNVHTRRYLAKYKSSFNGR